MPIWREPGSNIAFEQLTFDSNSINQRAMERIAYHAKHHQSAHGQRQAPILGRTDVDVSGENLHFNQVEMIGRGAWFGWSRQVFVDGCLSGESEDRGYAFGTWGGSDYAITNCTFQDADPSRPDGFAGGRMFVTQGTGAASETCTLEATARSTTRHAPPV